jgi:hypothetical protein
VVAAVADARRFCAARSGVEQDIGAGIISLTSAVGGGVSRSGARLRFVELGALDSSFDQLRRFSNWEMVRDRHFVSFANGRWMLARNTRATSSRLRTARSA